MLVGVEPPLLAVVEDRGVFAGPLAVLAPDPDRTVPGERPIDLLELVVADFLQPDDAGAGAG